MAELVIDIARPEDYPGEAFRDSIKLMWVAPKWEPEVINNCLALRITEAGDLHLLLSVDPRVTWRGTGNNRDELKPGDIDAVEGILCQWYEVVGEWRQEPAGTIPDGVSVNREEVE